MSLVGNYSEGEVTRCWEETHGGVKRFTARPRRPTRHDETTSWQGVRTSQVCQQCCPWSVQLAPRTILQKTPPGFAKFNWLGAAQPLYKILNDTPKN